MHSIKEVIEYWTTNYYTQTICVYSLGEIIRLQYGLEYEDWHTIETVFDSIIDNTSVNENMVIKVTRILEKIIPDKKELAHIACILAGEYLTSDEKDLIALLEYYNWNISQTKNIFIDWYFKIIGKSDYYSKAVAGFKKCKLLNSCRAIGMIGTGLTIPYLFFIVLMFMSRTYLTQLNSIILTIILFVLLLGTTLAAVLLVSNFKVSTLLRMNMGFKEYKL